MQRWRTFWALSARHKFILLLAFVVLPIHGLGLWLFNYARWWRLTQRFSFALFRGGEVSAEWCATAISLAAQHGIYPATCLPQATALWWLLSLFNVSSTIRFGVKKEANKLDAHAWIEYKGRALGQRTEYIKQFALLTAPFGGKSPV